ncbi:sulfatase [Natrinema amylolyticum]|uniref:sulfatase n=1 Tax=Natrinema amylolyticum TaxID=2878679 RepID=UPI001CFA1339|nr:sulfatase [Natrinema amylolyticum]
MPSERPNILFVVLDTVRARSLSLYGASHNPDVTLSRLAADGDLYTTAIAPSAWTLPSHVSMFTGELPSEHGATGPAASLDPGGSLPQRLAAAGYQTFGASANPFIGSKNSFADAFDEFCHLIPTPTTRLFERGNDALDLARNIDATGLGKLPVAGRRIAATDAPIRTATNLLWYQLSRRQSSRERRNRALSGGTEITRELTQFFHRTDGPFFAFANYMEAHRPYCAPKSYIEQYYPDDIDIDPDDVDLDPWAHILGVDEHTAAEIRAAKALYTAAIAYLDDQIELLLDEMDNAGIRENTIVVVTSDHGEAFGERGRLDHNCLYQPVTHVPLIIDHPGRGHSETTRPVSLRSLYPTLLHAAGIDDADGSSLFAHEATKEPVVSQYLDLHVKYLDRRFETERVDPYRERLQSSFSSTHQLLVGERGTEELLSMNGRAKPIKGKEQIREQLRMGIPSFKDTTLSQADSNSGPDKEMLRSLGYLE